MPAQQTLSYMDVYFSVLLAFTLGRYLRWNSWDILSNPFGLLDQITQRFINPFDHPRTWTMTIVFTAFFSIFYFTLKKLPKL
ncbi:MAG: DUF1361 domain-containing protein [Chitinophagaceae bacterium]